MLSVSEAKEILARNRQKQASNRDICDLLDIILRSENISTSSIRVSGDNEITVGVFTRETGELLPKIFEGYKVKAHVYSESIG